MHLRSHAVPIDDALAEWEALALTERARVATQCFLESAQSLESLLLHASINDIEAWNAFHIHQETDVPQRLLPLLEARLADPLSRADQPFIECVLRNYHPDLLDRLLKRWLEQNDPEEGNTITRALISHFSYDARPTYNAVLTRDASRDQGDALLERVDTYFCARSEQVASFVATHIPDLPADQADAILEALVLSRSVSVLPAVMQALIAADGHLLPGSERKTRSWERLLSLCKMEPRQAIIALPYLLAERLRNDPNRPSESDAFEASDRDLTRILITIQRDRLLDSLPADQTASYLNRLATLAERAQPRSFRLDLAAAIWNTAQKLSPTSPDGTIKAYLDTLERLHALRYAREGSASIEADTKEIRQIIERASIRLRKLAAFKKQQGL